MDFGEPRRNEGRVAAGGQDGGRGVQFALNGLENFTDHPAVTMDRTRTHGLGGRFADGGFRFGEINLGEKSGALVQVVGHGGQPRGNHAAEIAGLRPGPSHHVEGDRGSEVDHDGGRSNPGVHGHGVGQAIGADLLGTGIVNADGQCALVRDLVERSRGQSLPEESGFLRDDGGDDGGIEFEGLQFFDESGFQFPSGDPLNIVALLTGSAECELGAGVGVVDQEEPHHFPGNKAGDDLSEHEKGCE